jgi:electron transfer flavoprotein alpha subunit
MTSRIFGYIVHRDGVIDDSATELIAAAAKINPTSSVTAIVTGSRGEVESVAPSLTSRYEEVWTVASDALAHLNAEAVRAALVTVIPAGSIVLVPHTHFGIDLSPGLSVKLDAAYVSDVMDVESVNNTSLTVVRQEFGGQVSTHVRCDLSTGAVINVRPGAFKSDESRSVAGVIVDKSGEIGEIHAKRRYIDTIRAETGDVDITKQQVLVSVGRGIQEQDNVAMAEELAAALGGAVSCSRPVVDAKWMPKSRQVGSSGQTVKPKVYLACGISGSFQHLAGIKGNPFIVAVNKNAKAPIFRVADVGVVDDILEFIPALTKTVRDH